MAIGERARKLTDGPMTWTRAIVLGLLIWAVAIILLAQIPSLIIYKADQYVAELIEFSKGIPGVSDAGLNSTQVKIARDVVANLVQNGFLIAMLVIAYKYQENKRKRTGGKGLQDVVKGYMPGK